MPAAQTPTQDSSVPNIQFWVFDGAAAGNQTVTGIKTTDKLLAVLGIPDGAGAPLNLTSEFTITAANTINNTGGTSLAGFTGVVSYWRSPTQLG